MRGNYILPHSCTLSGHAYRTRLCVGLCYVCIGGAQIIIIHKKSAVKCKIYIKCTVVHQIFMAEIQSFQYHVKVKDFPMQISMGSGWS